MKYQKGNVKKKKKILLEIVPKKNLRNILDQGAKRHMLRTMRH